MNSKRVTKSYCIGTIINGGVRLFTGLGEFRTASQALAVAPRPHPLLDGDRVFIFESYSDFRSLPGSLGTAYGPVFRVLR